MSFEHLRQEDKPSHLEFSGIKDSWNSIPELAAFPSLASCMGTHSLFLRSLRWWIISGCTVLIFGHQLPPVFISVSLWLPVLFSSVHFFQLDMTLLLSPYLWICSTHTFANLPWVWSALSIWFWDALYMAGCHMPPSVTWLYLFLFLIIGFLLVSVLVMTQSLDIALCLMLWKECRKVEDRVLATFYVPGIFFFIFVLDF